MRRIRLISTTLAFAAAAGEPTVTIELSRDGAAGPWETIASCILDLLALLAAWG